MDFFVLPANPVKKLIITFLVVWGLLLLMTIGFGGFMFSVGTETLAPGTTVSTGWTIMAIIGLVVMSTFQAAIFTAVIAIFSVVILTLLKRFAQSQ